jgi:hypothetical protein
MEFLVITEAELADAREQTRCFVECESGELRVLRLDDGEHLPVFCLFTTSRIQISGAYEHLAGQMIGQCQLCKRRCVTKGRSDG